MESIPSIEQIDVSWLSSHFESSLKSKIETQRVGNGQVALCVRFSLTSNEGNFSFVAKAPSQDETSRATAKMQQLYLRETSFYKYLAPTLETRTPECFYVERDDEDNFLILLEDMAPANVADQFEGITKEMAMTGLKELAGLHAPTMNDTELHGADWLGGVSESLAPLMEAILPALFTQFIERYADSVDPSLITFVKRLSLSLDKFRGYKPYAPCVTHGDFRTDNLLFDAKSGEVPLCVVDWQTVSVGSPMLDVAYFLTTSLTEQDRNTYEDELINYYLTELSRLGGSLPLDIAREEFSRYTLQPVVMLVCAAVLVEQTERGDRMFMTMIERGINAATKWNALDELEKHAAS